MSREEKDQVEDGAASQEFHNDPEFGSLQITAKVARDVGVLALGENRNFLLDVLDFVLSVF